MKWNGIIEKMKNGNGMEQETLKKKKSLLGLIKFNDSEKIKGQI